MTPSPASRPASDATPGVAPRPAPVFAFDNSYARLPDRFRARVAPTPVAAPRLLQLNAPLARSLGLDPEQLASPDCVDALAGNATPPGADPVALAYAGHQFGHFVPQLGDGRAVLLGEIDTAHGRRDLQLKGSGPTPFSRGGDGRAALGPVLREYLVSEAMAALGIPTTRALAAIATGDLVYRETPLPGAVLTRVAASHIRVGTFQYFAARGDTDALRTLADHAIARHYPELAHADHPYRAFLDAVVARQAELVARWLLVGFVHGVMNTDNTAISGETIDYGPCAFLDAYDPATVFSSIDQAGRYAYAHQPRVAHWNLTRLAEALLPLLAPLEALAPLESIAPPEALAPHPATTPHAPGGIRPGHVQAGHTQAGHARAGDARPALSDDDQAAALAAAHAALDGFAPRFEAAYQSGLRAKLGLATARDGDAALAADLLARMAEHGADFTLTFRRLCDAADPAGPADPTDPAGPADDAPLRALFADPAACDAWIAAWRRRLAAEPTTPQQRGAAMRSVNPAVIPRNHLVEAALRSATEGDLRPFEQLLDSLSHPWDDRPETDPATRPPEPQAAAYRTFCGT